MGSSASGLGVATMSGVTQAGRSELLALRKKLRQEVMDRAAFEAASDVVGVEESDAEIFERLFTLYDTRGSGQVRTKEFLAGLATVTNCSLEERLHVACELFDDGRSGSLTRADLRSALRAMSKCCACFGDAQLSHDRIDELVDSVVVDGDRFCYRGRAPELAAAPVLEAFLAPYVPS
mmetsp:Transcript_13283/g.40175  ORF Transcript_13283/g.40175 Transcript_13283/m.40175 type:complete len:178 (-) Transcript_13283:190-723(-)